MAVLFPTTLSRPRHVTLPPLLTPPRLVHAQCDDLTDLGLLECLSHQDVSNLTKSGALAGFLSGEVRKYT
jgi:hypothetical protein